MKPMIRNRRALVKSVRDPLTFSLFRNAPRTQRRPRALLADAWSAAHSLAFLTHCRPR